MVLCIKLNNLLSYSFSCTAAPIRAVSIPMRISSTFIISAALLVSGCTSLKDFQRMDANTRAQFVCDRDTLVNQHKDVVSDLQSKIDNTMQALERGYRIHTSCRTVFISQPDVKCTSVEKDGKKTSSCEQITRIVRKEVCDEIPVSIDADLEKEHLQQYRGELEKAKIEQSTAYYGCHSRIHPMSAEESFNYFKQH